MYIEALFQKSRQDVLLYLFDLIRMKGEAGRLSSFMPVPTENFQFVVVQNEHGSRI